ncbi:MAG TPA: gas vesicle protein K [Syntrophales bacterium]|nr:gas vesicle protein K [Syntrophales bacterium]
MGEVMKAAVESSSLRDFAKVMNTGGLKGQIPAQEDTSRQRMNLDQDDVKNGLGQLVLTLVKLLHELLERQAIRRIDSGALTDEETERLGYTLMRQSEEIERLRKSFGLEEDDLNLDLGPLGRLL